MSQVEIRTPRLLLRGAKQDDLNAFNEWFRDPETMNFWSTAAHTSLSQTQAFLDSMIGSPYNGILDFAVCLLETSNSSEPSPSSEREIVIGKAGVWDGQEIGFIFNRAYWGKGYAFEALSAIMQQCWSTRKPEDIVKVMADVDPRNKLSLHLLNKLGFQVVGHAERTFKTHLGWCDSVYLEANALTKSRVLDDYDCING